MVSPFKSVSGLRRIRCAAVYSARGFGAAFRHEAAFRQELAVIVVLVPCAFVLGEGAVQILLLLGSLAAVLAVELLNSAVEALADALSLEHHPLLGRAKDLGSAAVMLAIGWAALVWLTFLVLYLRR
ncbi:diacylglycerol kinase [Verticiella sediminum]|uniref:Diacylglycerol kinase n=1 Tax=Verticiella sediminum TaxID=1247510 RepID=A0A556APQ7_9BURK|nr:diacylglycerol kinase [Verticiella sediminum]TSH94856.1 diacylglycerol kinase [Verticiella sediminum]